MRRLALILGVLVVGFAVVSCGEPAKERLKKDVDTYFAAAEEGLIGLDNAEEFMTFVRGMNDRSGLLDLLQSKYGDENFSDEEWEEIEQFMYDRATAYNKAESDKCTELLTPIVDRFEAIVNRLYPMFQAGDTLFDEASVDEFADAYIAITDFADCENVIPALSDRISPILEKEEEMLDVVVRRMAVLYNDK